MPIIDWIRDWGALVVACLAFGLSAYALWMNRTPKPSWRFVEKRHFTSGKGDGRRTLAQLAFTNDGPGTAERYGFSVKPPDSDWTNKSYPMAWTGEDNVVRGQTIDITAVEANGDETIPAGVYRFRLYWRQLPNTANEKMRAFRFIIEAPRSGPRSGPQ